MNIARLNPRFLHVLVVFVTLVWTASMLLGHPASLPIR